MTDPAVEIEADEDVPVERPQAVHPVLADEAYLTLAGKWIGIVEAHTEAGRAQTLIVFAACFGNCVGPGPRVVVGPGDDHRAKLYILLEGKSTVAAKDRTLSAARYPFQWADPYWYAERYFPKLSSGPGLIHAVRDPVVTRIKGDEDESDAGCPDEYRRVFAVLSEFCGFVKKQEGKGDTLSADTREGWGNAPLGNTSIVNCSRSTTHHISIVGAITPEEHLALLEKNPAEIKNGGLNRYLLVDAFEERDIPIGSNPPSELVEPFVDELRQRLFAARDRGEMRFSPRCRLLWDALYPSLKRPHPGILGDVLAKGRAHVVRLALIYALMDGAEEIDVPHLLAALAVWDYSRASAAKVFGRFLSVGDEGRVVRTILAAGGSMARTPLRRALANGWEGERLDAAIHALRDCGRLAVDVIRNGSKPTTVYTILSAEIVVPLLPEAKALAAELPR